MDATTVLKIVWWSLLVLLVGFNIAGLIFVPTWGVIRRLGGTIYVFYLIQAAFYVAMLDNLGLVLGLFVEIPWWANICLTFFTMILVAIAYFMSVGRLGFHLHLFACAVLTPLGLPLTKLARTALRDGETAFVKVEKLSVRYPARVSQEALERGAARSTVIEDAAEAAKKLYPIRTMRGTLLVDNSHAAGRVGERALNRLFTGRGYKKLESKIATIHGPDGIFVKFAANGEEVAELVIADAKINSAQLSGDQMTSAWLSRKLAQMEASGGELAETAKLVRATIQEHPERVQAQLWRFETETGRTTAYRLDRSAKSTEQIWDKQDSLIENVLEEMLTSGQATPQD